MHVQGLTLNTAFYARQYMFDLAWPLDNTIQIYEHGS